jgi:hypothetical protein
MPSDPDRVYIQSYKEAPDNAIVRESEKGRLYYCPKERSDGHSVGGHYEGNPLLEADKEEYNVKMNSDIIRDAIDVQTKDDEEIVITPLDEGRDSLCTEGDTFYSTLNDTEITVTEVEGEVVEVTTGDDTWKETLRDVASKIEARDWVRIDKMVKSYIESLDKESDIPHEMVYEIVSAAYPELTTEEARDALHEAADIAEMDEEVESINVSQAAKDVYDRVRVLYSEELEDEYDEEIESGDYPELEDGEVPEGVDTEEDRDEFRENLREQIVEAFGKRVV